GKLYRLGKNGDEVLKRIDRLGINIRASGISNLVDHLELRGAGAQREDEGVASFLALLHGRGIERVAMLGDGLASDDFGALGHIEFEAAVVHLSARRL